MKLAFDGTSVNVRKRKDRRGRAAAPEREDGE